MEALLIQGIGFGDFGEYFHPQALLWLLKIAMAKAILLYQLVFLFLFGLIFSGRRLRWRIRKRTWFTRDEGIF